MHEKKMTLRYFMLSFALGFLVLSVTAMLVVLYIPPQKFVAQEPAQDRADGSSYLPDNSDARNILVVVQDEEGSLEPTFLLVRFDPVRGQIPVAGLPAGTLLDTESGSFSLANLLDYGGVRKVSAQLSESLDITVDRFLKLTGQNLVELIDLLGGVQFQLEEPVRLTGSGARGVIDAGIRRLSGSMFYEVFSYRSYKGGEPARCHTAAALTAAVLNEYESLILTTEADTLFEKLVNMAQTNISAVDYQNSKPAARFMTKLAAKPSFAVVVEGSRQARYGLFTLTAPTTAQLHEIYSPLPQKQVQVFQNQAAPIKKDPEPE